jgi:hypothetical protein
VRLLQRPFQRLAISDNWNHLMRLRDMKYIGFKHQRENKQNSDKYIYIYIKNLHRFTSTQKDHIL